jgi:cell division topological specificity factor MinE
VLTAAALRVPSAAATRASGGRTPPEPLDVSKLSLLEKVAFAWSVFFPPQEADHARNDAKKRLRMILVADRCALSPQSMSDMKSEIVRVVSEFVIVDQGEVVDVNMTNDEEMGTIYSVSIPVKRIKPAVRGTRPRPAAPQLRRVARGHALTRAPAALSQFEGNAMAAADDDEQSEAPAAAEDEP